MMSSGNTLIIGLILFSLAAIFSTGYHHPDEHFQVLEFANFKLGKVSPEDLPWEFVAQIRPGLQPFLAFLFFKCLNFGGLGDPFWQTTLLRLLTGAAALAVFFKLSRWLAPLFPKPEMGDWLLAGAVGLWFMPYLSVRFSSENLGALAFLLGILTIFHRSDLDGKRRFARLLFAGLWLGLSFWFRFQLGFALIGLGAWLLFFGKMSLSDWVCIACGAVLATGLGLWADCWLYGERVFTPYNYFTANITENRAAEWGVSPWWFYFTDFLASAAPPLSLILLVLAGAGFWALRRHVLAWSFVPFLLGHLLVGHKELRFLFPMLLPFLAFATMGAGILLEKFPRKKMAHRLLLFCLVVNLPLLAFRTLAPAQESVPYFRFLYGFAGGNEAPVLMISEKTNPFHRVGLPMNFYKSDKINLLILSHLNGISDNAEVLRHDEFLVFHQQLNLDLEVPGYAKTRAYSLFPDWIGRLNFNDWQGRSRIWSIYRFKRTSK